MLENILCIYHQPIKCCLLFRRWQETGKELALGGNRHAGSRMTGTAYLPTWTMNWTNRTDLNEIRINRPTSRPENIEIRINRSTSRPENIFPDLPTDLQAITLSLYHCIVHSVQSPELYKAHTASPLIGVDCRITARAPDVIQLPALPSAAGRQADFV